MNAVDTYQDEILVVDDTPASLKLLADILGGAGYRVRLATDGDLALRSVKTHPPVLVLLDIRMPGMDGYEVCQRLKDDEKTRSIPVIFLSMLEDEREKVKAFQVGGVDYINKPIRAAEVLARVSTHLALRHAQLDLEARNAELEAARDTLEERVRERSAELEQINQRLKQQIDVHLRTLEALRESEAKYRRMVDTASEGIWGIGPDYLTTFVNAKMAAMLGRTSDEMTGRPVTDFMFDEDAPDHHTWMEKRRHGISENYECRFLRKDGQTVWTLAFATPIFDDDYQFQGSFAMFTDITERKRAEDALREMEQKYRLLVANAGEAIFVVQDGVVAFPNAKALELTGYSAEELVETPFAQLIHPEERTVVVERYLQQAGGNGPAETPRFRIVNKQGGQVWTQLTAADINWEERPGTLCFLRDITEEMKLEGQFLQAQKMEAVGLLAGGVAHDFNNLLQVILGYVDLVQENLGRDTPNGEALGTVHQAAVRAADLTRQLLAFSRRQIIQPVTLDVNDMVQGVLKMIRRVIGEHIELCYMPGDRLGMIHADKGQLEQVLMNLCVNARDAMPAGGTLTIEAENVVIDEDYCREHPWAAAGRYVLVTVSDTGQGMDEATRAQIFDPFFTTKGVGQGTGLGLATVYGIVKQHNGLIHVYSEPGKGTAFKIYIPFAERRAEVLESKIEPRIVGGTETILVAEDEEGVRRLVSNTLKKAGYTVLTACDGEDALRVFEEHADALDLALLDVMMPKLGGRAVMDRIQAKRPEMRFLFCSGYSQNALDTNFVVQDGLRLVTKPYRKADLLRAVRETLDMPLPDVH